MATLTLLVKVYDRSQSGLIKDLLKSGLEGLDAELGIQGATTRGWVQIDVSGEDEKTAVNYLTREFGQCPEQLKLVGKFQTIKGRIAGLDKNKAEVSVDIGVFSPSVVDATIPLVQLQAQIADGRKVSLRKLTELFGLCENLPLTVKILNIAEGENHIDAMLAEKQVLHYGNWISSLLDRLIIIGTTSHSIEAALKKAECSRDIVGIESLGLLEHCVVCKLGTDATGLIPKIGRHLREAAFSVFNPKRILEFLQDGSALLTSQPQDKRS
jgi:hypothetical protein